LPRTLGWSMAEPGALRPLLALLCLMELAGPLAFGSSW
jgi:hypothetical protein